MLGARPPSSALGRSAVLGRRCRRLLARCAARRPARHLAALTLTAAGTAAATTVTGAAVPAATARRTAGRARGLTGGCARGCTRGRLTALPPVRVAAVRGGRRVAGAARHQEEGCGREQGDGGDETCTLRESQLLERRGSSRAASNQRGLGVSRVRAVPSLCERQSERQSDHQRPSTTGTRRLSPTAWPSPTAATGRPVGPRCPRPRRPPPGNLRRDCAW